MPIIERLLAVPGGFHRILLLGLPDQRLDLAAFHSLAKMSLSQRFRFTLREIDPGRQYSGLASGNADLFQARQAIRQFAGFSRS